MFENYNANSGLSEDEVTAIYPLQNGDLVLANPLSFNILNTSVNKYNIQKANQFNVRILDVAEDVENNQLLFATNDGGLMIYSANNFQSPLQIIESPQSRFTTVELFNGAVYVAGDAGIWKKEGKAFSTILDLESTRNLGVLGDQLGIFTIYDGVYTYDGKELRHFTSNIIDLNNVYDGVVYKEKTLLATSAGLATIKNNKILLASDFDIRTPVYSLLNDSQNNLWIGTDHGVYKFNGYDLKLYDYDKGLLGNEVNRNALIEDASGNIWIGTEKGASVFKGDIALTKNINLEVDIISIVSDENEMIQNLENEKITIENNNLDISFRCLSYIDEEKINYRYKIDDNDQSWIYLTNPINTISQSNMKWGDYFFQIQARYDTGSWGPISSFQFRIKTPFYYRWWFILLIALIFSGLARIAFYFRYLLLIRKQQKLKQLVAERTKEINQLNEKLEEKVRERTKELNDKNLRLEEYAFINAHHLRGPLSKIMSVVYLAENDGIQLTAQETIKILRESVDELDSVIYSINDILKEKID